MDLSTYSYSDKMRFGGLVAAATFNMYVLNYIVPFIQPSKDQNLITSTFFSFLTPSITFFATYQANTFRGTALESTAYTLQMLTMTGGLLHALPSLDFLLNLQIAPKTISGMRNYFQSFLHSPIPPLHKLIAKDYSKLSISSAILSPQTFYSTVRTCQGIFSSAMNAIIGLPTNE